MTTYSTAHYFLEALVDLGIDYIFANLGTDHVSLIEEIARWDSEGRRHPEVILCPHEVVAVHIAAGYAFATGRGADGCLTMMLKTPPLSTARRVRICRIDADCKVQRGGLSERYSWV